MNKYNSDLKELKATLQTISNEDSRDAELLTDGDGDVLRGRAELAQSLIAWVEQKESVGIREAFDKWLKDCPVQGVEVETGGDDEDWLIISLKPSIIYQTELQEEGEEN